jgi:hypothetical protein
MGQEPVTSVMFQKIALQGTSIDDAYNEAVERFKTEMEAWKAENEWKAPDPNWQPPGMK